MLEMYKGGINPKTSRNVGEVLHDLNVWEGHLEEYYRCGGAPLDERTNLLTTHRMIPHDTNPSIKLAVKKVGDYEGVKRELRTTLNFLDSFSQSSAHAIEPNASANHGQRGARENVSEAHNCEMGGDQQGG